MSKLTRKDKIGIDEEKNYLYGKIDFPNQTAGISIAVSYEIYLKVFSLY